MHEEIGKLPLQIVVSGVIVNFKTKYFKNNNYYTNTMVIIIVIIMIIVITLLIIIVMIKIYFYISHHDVRAICQT